jgi:ligand-binding sensor domain-containing protein
VLINLLWKDKFFLLIFSENFASFIPGSQKILTDMIKPGNLPRQLIRIILLTTCISAAGQFNEIKFDHLTVEDGLSQGNALITIQDSRGFMWIGTEDGLNLYDGYQFRIFRNDPRDSTSISSNFVRAIAEDKDGNLWIGTGTGLNCYRRDEDNFIRMVHDPENPNSIVADGVQELFIDSKNRLWILTEQGINVYDIKKNKMRLIENDPTYYNTLPSNFTRYVIEDSHGRFWIATYSGLSLYEESENKFTNFTHDPDDSKSISGNKVQRIFEDSRGRLWVGTFDKGLNLMDVNSGIFRQYISDPADRNSIPNNLINCIAESLEGQIWIGTSGGLCLYNEDSDNFTVFYQKEDEEGSLSSSDIANIYFDVNNRMWISTRFGGLSIYDRGKYKFLHYKKTKYDKNSLSNNNVTSFAEDEYGNIWIGTDGGGLNYFNRKTNRFSHIMFDPSNPEGLTNNKVLALRLGSDGMLWIGMWGGGVNVYNPDNGEFRHYVNDPDDESSLSDNNIFYIYEDSRNDIWICTWGNGLNKYNRSEDNFTRYVNDENDPNSFATSAAVMMTEDYFGNLWIASEGAGIFMYDREQDIFVQYGDVNETKNETEGIGNVSVYSLYEDSKKRLWIGTNGGGLNLYNRENNTFKIYRMSDGLPNDAILGIVEDNEGNLWLSTNEGLCKFNPDSLSFKNYNASDGLQSNQFGRWAFKKLSTGELLFGGVNGFNMFIPEQVRDNPYKPPVYITGFKLFNEEVEIGEESILKKDILVTKHIKLKYNQNIFSLEYTALNYRQSQKNRYMYMMEGFNDEWIDAKNERKVSFTNLDPGDYVFRVKASNNDGIWNDEGASLEITIVPPFWRTWLFYIISAAVILYIIYYIIRRREGQVKKDKVILQKKLKEGKEELDKQKKEIEKQAIALQKKEEAERVQKWYNAGLAKFSDLTSKNKDDVNTLAKVLITNLVEYLEANQGGMFIISDNEKGQYLEMAGSYGYEKKKSEIKKFKIGEGQVGTCFKEKDVILVDDLPEDYARLSSGLGETRCRHLALIPLKLDELVMGVVEIVSLEKLEPYKIEFVGKMGEMVTATLATIRANENMKKMYEEIKQKTEELTAQEEELRQNLEEMAATQEEMGRRGEEFRKMSDEFKIKEKQYKKEINRLKAELSKYKKK